jgi:pseudouridine synthase
LRIYNKPKWVLSVMNDNKGRKNLGDLDFIRKMHPVGRLDYDTSGLLLFSSDGGLTQHLLHPSHEIEKEYVAIVVGTVDEDSLRDQLAQGVTTSLGAFKAKLAEAKPVPSDEVKPLITDILDNLPEEYDLERLKEKGYLFFEDAAELSQVRLVVQEGEFLEES